MNAKTLLSLAERCEQATGPDAELDEAIAVADGWAIKAGYDWRFQREFLRPDGALVNAIAKFTASLDAAMTLVPEGSELVTLVLVNSPGYSPSAGIDGGRHKAHAATGPLALCAAALRARAAIAVTRPKDEDASSAASLASGGGARQRNRPTPSSIDIGGEEG